MKVMHTLLLSETFLPLLRGTAWSLSFLYKSASVYVQPSQLLYIITASLSYAASRPQRG